MLIMNLQKMSNINFYLIQKSYNKIIATEIEKINLNQQKEALKDIIRKHNLL